MTWAGVGVASPGRGFLEFRSRVAVRAGAEMQPPPRKVSLAWEWGRLGGEGESWGAKRDIGPVLGARTD